MEAYQDAIPNHQGYMVFVLHPTLPRKLKLRTKKFPGKRHVILLYVGGKQRELTESVFYRERTILIKYF